MTIEFNNKIVSTIIGLLFSRGPLAITGLVMAACIYAINRMAFGWRLSHISVEVFKLLPAFTNLYAMTAIIFIVFICTTSSHAMPMIICRRVMRQPMCRYSFKAITATRNYEASAQRATVNHCLSSAVATTKKLRVAARNICNPVDHRQSTKTLSCYINEMRHVFLFVLIGIFIMPIFTTTAQCDTLINRCRKYQPQVVREVHYFLGINAPDHYIMSQIELESRCNEGITAFDGGAGLGQFMPDTAIEVHGREKALQELSPTPEPYDAAWAIRAITLYDKWLSERTVCLGWYYAFRAYNGGLGGINREIRRANSCCEPNVEAVCRRRVLTLKNGSKLDLCTVNIEYPHLIFKRSLNYRRTQ